MSYLLLRYFKKNILTFFIQQNLISFSGSHNSSNMCKYNKGGLCTWGGWEHLTTDSSLCAGCHPGPHGPRSLEAFSPSSTLHSRHTDVSEADHSIICLSASRNSSLPGVLTASWDSTPKTGKSAYREPPACSEGDVAKHR